MHNIVNAFICFTCFQLVDVVAVDTVETLEPSNIHKIAMVSKVDFLKPIKRCEIKAPSGTVKQNSDIIVRACNVKEKRLHLIGFKKANYTDGRRI